MTVDEMISAICRDAGAIHEFPNDRQRATVELRERMILDVARRAVNAERAYRDLIAAPRPLGRFASETHDERIRKARDFAIRMAKEIGL